jgi:hypothetical protein
MTDKKDFTSIHDLGEFEHTDDPDIEAQLADEFSSKTTVTSLDELDDDNGFGDSPLDEDPPEEFDDPESFDEFNYSADSDDVSLDDPTDPAMEMSGDLGETEGDNWQDDQTESFGADSTETFDTDSTETDNTFSEDATSEFSTDDATSDFSMDDVNDLSDEAPAEISGEFAEETPEEVLENISDEMSVEATDSLEEQTTEDLIAMSEQDDIENEQIEQVEEFPEQNANESFLDQMTSPVAPVENFQSGQVMPSSNEYESSVAMGSLGHQELEQINTKHMMEVADSISDNVPEIPSISTTYNDFKQNVENLSYAPSPEATGPLFAVHIKGSLFNYKDHIQSIFDEYMIGINLNEETYLMPLQSGFLQVSRISEFILIQLTNALSKYGFTIEAFYLEDIISPENVEDLESRGLESEYNLPQNLADNANFAEKNDWDEDDILITVTSGPKGYKVLKRCGITQKMITLPREDFENLQTNLNQFFNDDVHLSGSSTLMDGLIEKIHEELKEDARSKGANCMVNFKLEQTLDINVVILHFSADLLYLRKLNEY